MGLRFYLVTERLSVPLNGFFRLTVITKLALINFLYCGRVGKGKMQLLLGAKTAAKQGLGVR
jgi:hypothetical protein